MSAGNPVQIFIGVDPRQPVAYHALCDSIMWRTSRPVRFVPLLLKTLPIKRRGLTDFTYSRFLVPWLSDYEGYSLFMDADILVMEDIAELIDSADHTVDVQVLQDQPRFEWSSVMLFNNAKCRVLTPEFIDSPKNSLFDFSWADCVGSLAPEWNRCVGYSQDNSPAKLYHFTAGIPVWDETKGNHPEDALWIKQFRHMNSTASWTDLMGKSVHADSTLKRQRLRSM